MNSMEENLDRLYPKSPEVGDVWEFKYGFDRLYVTKTNLIGEDKLERIRALKNLMTAILFNVSIILMVLLKTIPISERAKQTSMIYLRRRMKND